MMLNAHREMDDHEVKSDLKETGLSDVKTSKGSLSD